MGEAGDVDEEDGHLLALALDRAAGGEDLLDEVPGSIAPKTAGCGRVLGSQGRPTLMAELGAGWIGSLTNAAGQHVEPRATVTAEERSGRVRMTATLAHDPLLRHALSWRA